MLVMACAAGSGDVGDPIGTAGSATGGRAVVDGTTGGELSILPPQGGVDAGDDCAVGILGEPGENPAANFAAWIEARGPIVDRFAPGGELETLTPAQLSEYDVVVLDWLAPETTLGITPQELETWVQGGGRLIALSGYADYPEALAVQNQMLAPLGISFVTEQVLWGPVTQFVSHPITANLTEISFIGGREVTSGLPTIPSGPRSPRSR
jgi:hypothetical protein